MDQLINHRRRTRLGGAGGTQNRRPAHCRRPAARRVARVPTAPAAAASLSCTRGSQGVAPPPHLYRGDWTPPTAGCQSTRSQGRRNGAVSPTVVVTSADFRRADADTGVCQCRPVSWMDVQVGARLRRCVPFSCLRTTADGAAERRRPGAASAATAVPATWPVGGRGVPSWEMAVS